MHRRLHHGSSLYAAKILDWLTALSEDGAPQRPLPAPIDPENRENAALLDPLSLSPGEQWRFCRSHTLPWADMMLVTTCLGAKLQIPFTGTGLSLVLDFGQTSADFCYRVDGGDPIPAQLDYPDWCGDSGWVRAMELGYPLERGDHVIELEVVRPAQMRAGSRFDIMLLGVIP